MTDQRNRLSSKLAKSWAWVTSIMIAMDTDPLVCTRDKVSMLQDEVADLISRIEQLEASVTKHS